MSFMYLILWQILQHLAQRCFCLKKKLFRNPVIWASLSSGKGQLKSQKVISWEWSYNTVSFLTVLSPFVIHASTAGQWIWVFHPLRWRTDFDIKTLIFHGLPTVRLSLGRSGWHIALLLPHSIRGFQEPSGITICASHDWSSGGFIKRHGIPLLSSLRLGIVLSCLLFLSFLCRYWKEQTWRTTLKDKANRSLRIVRIWIHFCSGYIPCWAVEDPAVDGKYNSFFPGKKL